MSKRVGLSPVFASEGDVSTRCPVCGNICGLDYSRRTLRTHWADSKARDHYCELSESKVTILDPSLDPANTRKNRSEGSKCQSRKTTRKVTERRETKPIESKLQEPQSLSRISSNPKPSKQDVPIKKSVRRLRQEAAAALGKRKRETKPSVRLGMVAVWTENPESGELEWAQLNPIQVQGRGVCQCPMCGATVTFDLRRCRLHGHKAQIQGQNRECPAAYERFAFVDRFGKEIGRDLPPEKKHLALSNMSQGTDRVLKKKRAPLTEEQRRRRIANRRKRNMEKMTMFADSPYFDEEKYQVSENSINALPGGLYGSNRRH